MQQPGPEAAPKWQTHSQIAPKVANNPPLSLPAMAVL